MCSIRTDLCVENNFQTEENEMGMYCFSCSIYIHCILYSIVVYLFSVFN